MPPVKRIPGLPFLIRACFLAAPLFMPAKLQADAPEVLTLRVNGVQMLDATAGSGSKFVTGQATVLAVQHTSTNLTPGTNITLHYIYVPLTGNMSGQAPVPIINSGVVYTAYLGAGFSIPDLQPSDKKTSGDADKMPHEYVPAAHSQSFVPADAAPSSSSPTVPSGVPIADPDLLPTPQKSAPFAVIVLHGADLDKFVTLTQQGTQWLADIASFKDPIPIKAASGFTPAAWAYYLPPLRAPLTQPCVLLYSSGTDDSITLPGGPYSFDRALIIDRNGHLLGDVVWGIDVPGPDKPAQPQWTWSASKLTVQNPLDHSIQEIDLTPGASSQPKGLINIVVKPLERDAPGTPPPAPQK